MRMLLLVLPALLAGCASMGTVQSTGERERALRGQPVTVVRRVSPDFEAITAGKMAAGLSFGAIGAAVAQGSMARAGAAIVRERQIADPADAILSRLGLAYVEALDAQVMNALPPHQEADAAAIARAAGHQGAVLEVETQHWAFVYKPLNWGRYEVLYRARARLIDGTTGSIVSQVPCSYTSDAGDAAPTYEQLLDNEAARLKAMLATAGAVCAEQLEQQMLASVPRAPALMVAPAPEFSVEPASAAPTSVLASAPVVAQPPKTSVSNASSPAAPLLPDPISDVELARVSSSFEAAAAAADSGRPVGERRLEPELTVMHAAYAAPVPESRQEEDDAIVAPAAPAAGVAPGAEALAGQTGESAPPVRQSTAEQALALAQQEQAGRSERARLLAAELKAARHERDQMLREFMEARAQLKGLQQSLASGGHRTREGQ